MYNANMNMSFDINPMEIIRKYGFVIAGAAVSFTVIVALYYKGYIGGDDIIDDTINSTTDVIDKSSENIMADLNSI